MTASRSRNRGAAQVELFIRLVAPVLDVVLVAGERISRFVHPGDPGYVMPRMRTDGEAAPRGLRRPPGRR